MRVLVFFDLPTNTMAEKREYRRFRKFLIRSGFIMLQKSVYSKLVLNTTAGNMVMANTRKNKPKAGLVQMLSITENQFAKMEFVVGESVSDMLDSTERLVIL